MPTNLLGHAPARQWHQVMINGVRFDAVTVVDVLDHVTMSIQTDAPGGLILTVNLSARAADEELRLFFFDAAPSVAKRASGKNPWDTLLTVPDYKVLENFPWDKTQFMPLDYGKP